MANCGFHVLLPYETETSASFGGMETTVKTVYCPKCGAVEEMDEYLEDGE